MTGGEVGNFGLRGDDEINNLTVAVVDRPQMEMNVGPSSRCLKLSWFRELVVSKCWLAPMEIASTVPPYSASCSRRRGLAGRLLKAGKE
jgi:hypothetical protein